MLTPIKDKTRFSPRTPTTVNPAIPIPDLGNPTNPAIDNPAANIKLDTFPSLGFSSSFDYGEAVGALAIKMPIINFTVPLQSKRRKLYAYLFADVTVAGTYQEVRASIICSRNGSKVAAYPLNTATSPAGDLSLKASMPSICISTATDGTNAIQLNLAALIAGETDFPLLQAHMFFGEIDAISVNLEKIVNSTNIRLWVGCESA